MKCPWCDEVAVTDYYRPELAWCRCGWASPAMHGPDPWDIKLTAIEAECEDIEDLRDALTAMAEPGPLVSWDELMLELGI